MNNLFNIIESNHESIEALIKKLSMSNFEAYIENNCLIVNDSKNSRSYSFDIDVFEFNKNKT